MTIRKGSNKGSLFKAFVGRKEATIDGIYRGANESSVKILSSPLLQRYHFSTLINGYAIVSIMMISQSVVALKKLTFTE